MADGKRHGTKSRFHLKSFFKRNPEGLAVQFLGQALCRGNLILVAIVLLGGGVLAVRSQGQAFQHLTDRLEIFVGVTGIQYAKVERPFIPVFWLFSAVSEIIPLHPCEKALRMFYLWIKRFCKIELIEMHTGQFVV